MDVAILGAGGHGKVVLDILRATGEHNVVGFIDSDRSLQGTSVCGVPVLGTLNNLPKLRQQHQIEAAVIAIGDNRARRSCAAVAAEHGLKLINAIHPTAVVSPAATIGCNVVIAAGAVVCVDARVGDSAIINTSAVVDHEAVVGEAAHIAPGALLAGRAQVGAGAFIGLGAKIIQCLKVGDDAIVGAGAVVINDVPPRVTVVGVPAAQINASTR